MILHTALVLLQMTSAAAHGVAFPTVTDIERQLPLVPGAQLPKQVANPKTGEVFNVYYLRGRDLGGGNYEADLHLSPR